MTDPIRGEPSTSTQPHAQDRAGDRGEMELIPCRWFAKSLQFRMFLMNHGKLFQTTRGCIMLGLLHHYPLLKSTFRCWYKDKAGKGSSHGSF
nr:hypothetical protein CFP56_42551 [Quercus suber]